MRTRSLPGAAGALIVAILVVAAALMVVRQPFAVVYPLPELRSFEMVPTAIAFPAFYAGPIQAGNVVDQELRLTPDVGAVRVWLGPAQVGVLTRARIELLDSPRGPSRRSGVLDLQGQSGPVTARIVPPLRPSEVGDDGVAVLRVAPVEGSQAIRVGMAKGKTYRPGRAFIVGQAAPEDQDVMFEVARELSPGGVWSVIWSQIESETLAVRAVAAAAPIVLVAGLATCVTGLGRRRRSALLTFLVALAAATLVVIDRTTLSLMPGPDFNPTVFLR